MTTTSPSPPPASPPRSRVGGWTRPVRGLLERPWARRGLEHPWALRAREQVRHLMAREESAVDVPASGLRRVCALAALVASAVGPLTLVTSLPAPVRAVALLVFVLVGPGCAVVCWTRLAAVLRVAAIPVLGIAAVLLSATPAAMWQWWNPPTLLLSLVVLTVASALGALVLPETDRPAAGPTTGGVPA